VVRLGDRWLVSQSNGLSAGRLWTGNPTSFGPHEHPLPVGAEDLALDPERELLWTLGEHPWRRVVRAIPYRALGL
jgi:hypothetical protein